MRSLLNLGIAALLAGCVGLSPHSDPSTVTDAEIGAYKLGLKKGCAHQGSRKGDPAAEAFCECVVKGLEQSLTTEEWQAVTYAAQKRDDKEETRVFAPHMANARACNQGLVPK